jgi:hypothetical protein
LSIFFHPVPFFLYQDLARQRASRRTSRAQGQRIGMTARWGGKQNPNTETPVLGFSRYGACGYGRFAAGGAGIGPQNAGSVARVSRDT